MFHNLLFNGILYYKNILISAIAKDSISLILLWRTWRYLVGEMMQVNHRILVKVGDKTTPYSTEFLTEPQYAAGLKSVLQKARQYGVVTCDCQGAGDKQLSVRYWESSDLYILARWPGSGPEHARDCKWWSMITKQSGLKQYQDGVVKESADGTVTVRLATGMTRKDPQPTSSVSPTPPAYRGSTRQSVMTLLGLLHLLWTSCNLNRWYPRMEGKRNFGLLNYLLHKHGQDIRSGGVYLSDVLLLPAGKDSKEAIANNERVEQAIKLDHRMIAIAPLARYNQERDTGNGHLPIAHFFGYPLLGLPDGAWSSILTRFPIEIAAWRAGHRVVAIVQADVPYRMGGKTVHAKVLQVGLMWISDRLLPLDSSYEHRLERQLSLESRAFIKPMRFDASEDDVLPDFCLLDTNGTEPFPMEVFGMNTPEYLQRKQSKIEWYNKKYGQGGWWYWDAAADPDGSTMPALPCKREG